MIPKVLHFVWIGEPMQPWLRANLSRWQKINPEWEIRIWGQNALSRRYESLYDRIQVSQRASSGPDAPDLCTRSDILRLSVLRRYGGFYFDCDFVPLRPMSYLLSKYGRMEGAFFSKQWEEGPKRIANGVMGMMPKTDGSPLWDAVDRIVEEHSEGKIQRTSFGPLFTTRLTIEYPEVIIGEIDDFYKIRFQPKGNAVKQYLKILKTDFDAQTLRSVFGRELPFAMHLWMGRQDYHNKALNTQAKHMEQITDRGIKSTTSVPKKFAVACVLKDGPDYNEEYVRRLVHGCECSFTGDHDVVCLSDKHIDVPCKVVKLRHNWPGWWSKIELFRPDVFEEYERVIYLDLDTVLVGNTDGLVSHPCRFAMLHGFRKPERRASGIMVWEGDFSKLYYQMVKQERQILVDEKAWDQVFIADNVREYYCEPDLVQDMIDGVVSYKNHVRGKGGLPKGTRIVCFHGRPRPMAVCDEYDWMKEFWG